MWTNDGQVYWRILASLDLYEFNFPPHTKMQFKHQIYLITFCANSPHSQTVNAQRYVITEKLLVKHDFPHTGPPLTKVSNAVLWYHMWCPPQQAVEQTVELTVMWDAMATDGCGPLMIDRLNKILNKQYSCLGTHVSLLQSWTMVIS